MTAKLSRGDQSTVFCIVSFDLTDPGLQRSGTLLHWFAVVVLPIFEDLFTKRLSRPGHREVTLIELFVFLEMISLKN